MAGRQMKFAMLKTPILLLKLVAMATSCHGNVLWAIAKLMQDLSNPYIATNIKNLVKIRPVVYKISLLVGLPLKW